MSSAAPCTRPPHAPSAQAASPLTRPPHAPSAPLRARLARALLATLALLLSPHLCTAQVDPTLDWRTLRTPHFRVHFSPGLDSVARRAAGSAERAWGRLAAELHEPRGPVDLVVADNVDYTNGNATVFPSNRITIFARPVIDASSLRFLDDWIDLAVSHELTHIFHLDRSRGWWRLGQYLFGRNPFLFPGLYTPSWLDEGIAVYYETRLTGAGRIAGTSHASIVRAQLLDSVAPALTAISQATPRWPGGNQVYAYGSLLVDYEARRRPTGAMRAFIDGTAARTIPFLLNTNARAAFGIGFDSALVAFTDSVHRAALAVGAPTLHDLTTTGWSTEQLRWLDAGHLRYANDDARDVTALRDVDAASGATRWVERRNSLDVTSTLRDGARLFTQLDFTDPYTLRGDLYLERGGATARLTDGARLTQADAYQPDRARASAVVAVQLEPGVARLVRLNVEGARAGPVERLTGASIDTLWSQPRWSHDGTRIAAARWRRGGTQDIVVLDATTGRVLQSVGASRAIVASPAWSAGDTAIYFTSDRSGRSSLYRASLATGALSLVASSATALTESEPSPDGTRLATTQLRGDGVHVAIVPLGAGTRADSASVLPAGHNDPVVVAGDSSSTYRPWRTLLPTYWLPVYQQTDDARPMYGFLTSGADVTGRHAFTLQTTYSPDHHEPSYDFAYSYAGLKNPLLGLASTGEWDHYPLYDSKTVGTANPAQVGTLSRRKIITDLALTFQRPRVRTNASLSVGTELEYRDFRTDPTEFLAQLNRGYSRSYTYPAFFVSAGYSNVKFPALAISYEDGVQLAMSARTRWRSDSASGTHSNSVVAVASAFKSLDFAGFAHHVIALRAAAGWESPNSPTEFDAGGTSGSQLSVIPGVVLGDGRRTFGVRGFAGDALYGTQALGGTIEYRAPLGLPNGGLWSLPLFFRSLSGIAFADAATAWCPADAQTFSAACPRGPTPRDWLASAGAELDLDAALEYDVPYRFRLGVAQPIAGRQYTRATGPALFFALGLSF